MVRQAVWLDRSMGEEIERRGSGKEEENGGWNVEDDDQRKRRDRCYDQVMTNAMRRLMERNYIYFLTGYINQLVK